MEDTYSSHLKDFQRQPEIHAMFALQLSLEAAPHPHRRCGSTILKTRWLSYFCALVFFLIFKIEVMTYYGLLGRYMSSQL